MATEEMLEEAHMMNDQFDHRKKYENASEKLKEDLKEEDHGEGIELDKKIDGEKAFLRSYFLGTCQNMEIPELEEVLTKVEKLVDEDDKLLADIRSLLDEKKKFV